jgi:hypothetical protein
MTPPMQWAVKTHPEGNIALLMLATSSGWQ